MSEIFRVNDRVRATRNIGPIIEGNQGTIVHISGDFGIAWDGINANSGGHDLNGRLDNHSGYYVSGEYLTKVNPVDIPPRLNDSQRRRVMEVYESGIINQNEKNRQIQDKEEKLYMHYFGKVKEFLLPKVKILYASNYKIGDTVKTNSLAKQQMDSSYRFIEGVIVRKRGRLSVDVLIYKKTDDYYQRKGEIRNFHIKYLDHIKKHNCTLKFVDEGRLFPPKVTMTMKAINMKEMMKNINNIKDVEICSLIKSTKNDSRKYLSVITKELIFEYKKKKYNFGKYELKYLIPKKGERIEKNSDGIVNLGVYIEARRVDGALEMKKEQGWFHNPYINSVSIYSYDPEQLSEEELDKKKKKFEKICYGAGYKRAEEAYKTGDYYALTEVTIGNLLSTSNEGYIKFVDFLPSVPLMKERGEN